MLSDWDSARLSPWALLVPHAGYVYSGVCAAAAYAQIKAEEVSRVLLIGPNHHLPLRGIGLSRQSHWETPLGAMAVDRPAVSALLEFGAPFKEAEAALAREHSLEVQLPFLQRCCGDALLLPLLVGQCGEGERRRARQALSGIARPGDLWVVTTDLSHFHSHEEAEPLDTLAASLIAAGDPLAFGRAAAEGRIEACGAEATRLLLEENHQRGGRVELLDRRDSSLACGDRRQVVGYLAAVCLEGAGRA